MAGAHGRGRRGPIPNEEALGRDEEIAELRRQIADLTQRLAAQGSVEHVSSENDSDSSSFANLCHQQARERAGPYRRREEQPNDYGIKVGLPEFAGTLHAEGFIHWLHEIERVFEYKEVPDRVKVKLVSIKLKGRASAWWEQLRRSRDRQG